MISKLDKFAVELNPQALIKKIEMVAQSLDKRLFIKQFPIKATRGAGSSQIIGVHVGTIEVTSFEICVVLRSDGVAAVGAANLTGEEIGKKIMDAIEKL